MTSNSETRKNWDDAPSSSDAWKLMIYQCEKCKFNELIWNARPHVTPFGGVSCPHCSGMMSHTAFGEDAAKPEHEPGPGQRVFIDLPPEIALIYARRNVRQGVAAGVPIPGKKDPDLFAKELAEKSLMDYGGHSPYCMRLE